MSDNQETVGQEPQVTNDTVDDASIQGDDTSGQTPAPEADTAPETFDREYVEKLRKESGNYRTKAKELEDAVAAAKADSDALVQQIGKAFGFVTDDESEQSDANKIVEQLTSERDSLQSRLRNQSERIALTDAAKTHGADTDILIPYLKGTGALDDIDPAADDYADQVSNVVQDAVASNPKLAAQAADKRSGVDTTNTNTETVRKLSREDLSRLASEGKWDEINKAAADGRIA